MFKQILGIFLIYGWKIKSDKGNFIDLGAFFWDIRFNILARIPGDRANIASRRLEKTMAHVKSSRCARTIKQEAAEKIKRVREVGHSISIECKAGKPTPVTTCYRR